MKNAIFAVKSGFHLPPPRFVCVIGAALGLSFASASAERLLSESFENFDANNKPIGWQSAGHPSYLRVSNENDNNWSTPYGENAMSTYSTGVGTKTVGVLPLGVGDAADGDYTLKFNISSSAAKGEYRAEIWVYDGLNGWTMVASTTGDTDGSKDFSFSGQLSWRYNYDDWIDPLSGFSTIEGQQIQIKLMQDPNRADWRNTPVWDNVTFDYIPDIDTQAPFVEDFSADYDGIEVVAANEIVTYSVTFNEAMNPATVDTSDFGNSGSASVTIQSMSPNSDNTVFFVAVIPTSEGTLRLKIQEDAELEDVNGNSMNTSGPLIQDDFTFGVEAGIPTILPSDFVDDRGGAPCAENTLVTYTLTFSKDMDATTLSDIDFGNAGTAPITIGTINETSPGVFTVEVTPTGSGTLQLRVNQGVLIKAADGGELNTNSEIADDTTILVDSDPPILTDITDDTEGSPVTVGTLVTYDVFFSEDMDAATVDASDFGNAVTVGNAPFTINSIEEASPGVFRIELTPTGAGSIRLQINAGAILKDQPGNALVTTSAIIDDSTITVEGGNPYAAWADGAAFGADENGDSLANGMAWLLGADSPSATAMARLPVASQSGGNLVLTFTCLKVAGRGGAVLMVQYSRDLGINDLWWHAEVPDTSMTVNGVNFVTSANADPSLIDVQATIPASAAASGTTLFGRLSAVNAP